MTVRLRFAPSPTGYVHIGSLRTALYNFLYAKKHDGQYLIRIEDTDRSRYVEGSIENLLNSMDWAGVHHDEGLILEGDKLVQKGEYGPYIQSERLDIYTKHINELLKSGDAYYCFCSKERLDDVRAKQKEEGFMLGYDKHCRNIPLEEAVKRVEAGEPHVIRLRMPDNKDMTFKDLVRGDVTMNSNDSDDQVLIKSDGFPTYHFAVVIDDHLMGITHMVRGEEWLPSTPKQIALYEAFGWEQPVYAHLPNILNSDKKKLSKRQGDVAVEDFVRKGYLPEALVNYIALLGWSPDGEKEIMSIDEMISMFSFDRVSKSGGVFDVNKLNWVNSHYIKEADIDRLTKLCIPYLIEGGIVSQEDVETKYEWLKMIVEISRERIAYLSEIADYAKQFFATEINVDEDAKKMLKLEHVQDLLNTFREKVNTAEVVDAVFGKKVFKMIQKETGVKGKNLFMPIRAALTGQLHGPDMDKVIAILGPENINKRLDYIEKFL